MACFLTAALAVLETNAQPTPESSRNEFIRFKELAKAHGPGVTVKWIPGHKDIEGNEAADKLAKEGAMLAVGAANAPTVAWARRFVNKQEKKEFMDWWETQSEPRYEGVRTHTAVSKHLAPFKRKTIHRLLAARSGHGDFAQYHERFRHIDSNNHCSCGERKSPQHIFFCGRLRKHRLMPTRTPRAAYSTFLGDESVEWATFVEKTDFFMKICPR